jgi:hypothetical protein
MSFLQDLFIKPYSSSQAREVQVLLDELLLIGKESDFLSERPGGGFNGNCRNIRAREIGRRLDEMGGMDLMQWVFRQVRKKMGRAMAEHLEYAWDDVGPWRA